ncbi:hypothetical protein [Halorhabdus sp. BNX81]|uniref:hypothetical protein n=1 Tax=Halorhabdus sp. BNX81 TaxID=2980181 RepID=UPI0023DD25F6|nr:hypothetical protein [Halorhabdus sp. BNX81]WEL20400.1 Calcineurin family phosphoesterase [Halorhabdus sp. BNX81]
MTDQIDPQRMAEELGAGSPESVAANLRARELPEENYLDVVEAGLGRDGREGRTVLDGLMRAQPAGGVSGRVLRDACRRGDERLRREVIRSFRDIGREDALVTGAGLLTVEDASTVFRDYFEEGGDTKPIAEWLSLVGLGYRREKRKGNIDVEYDGWFQNTWNDIKEAGKSVAEAVNTVVDSVVEAGKSFGEVVKDVVDYAQRRINSVVETLLDGVKTVADIIAGIAQEAYSTIKKIVKGLLSAGKAIKGILREAFNIGKSFFRSIVRALRKTGETLTDIVVAAGSIGVDVLKVAARTLVDMVSYAEERANNIIEIVKDKLTHLGEEIIETLKDFVDEAYELAKAAVEQGLSAIIDQIQKAANNALDKARSVLQGLLDGGIALGDLLEYLHREASDFFSDAVSLLRELVYAAEDLFAAALDLGEWAVGAVMEALVAAGESVADLVAWARDAGAAAVRGLLDALATVGELTTDALYQFGKAVVEIGEGLVDLVERAADWGRMAARAVFDGILAAGGAVGDILETLWDRARDFLREGIDTLLDVGARIRDVLAAGLNLGLDVLEEFIEHLYDLGRSIWYILDWVVDTVERVGEVLETAFQALIDIGVAIGELVAWCARRTIDIMRAGFGALLAIGIGLGEILVTLLTDPGNVFSTAVDALRDVGASIRELFEAITDAGQQVLGRLYRALRNIGVALGDVLGAIVEAGKETFTQLLEGLLKVGVTAFEVVLWAADRAFDIFGWVMEVVEAALDSLLDLIEWAAGLGGPVLEQLAEWFAKGVSNAFDFVRDKVIAPLLAAGKLALVVTLATASLPFLAVAYVVLGSLVNPDQVDYKHWPTDFRSFECDQRVEIRELSPPAEDRGIVVFSDLHMEDQDDIDAGLDHFSANADLVESVLSDYAADEANGYEWTVVFNGDSEEFWIDNDLTANEPADKVDDIVATHPTVHETVSEDFYKFESPRRFVKVRGNHDASYEDPHVVGAYEDHGFPDLEVYDFVTTTYDGEDVLITHGHQFDPWNCDANNDFGKFSSNFVGEPIDVLSDTLEDVFGEDASLEGETITAFGEEIPVHAIAPYYDPGEWRPIVDSDVKSPSIEDGAMFEESAVVETIRQLDASLIIGHTHVPKLMEDGTDNSRFYVNTGTAGWWEDCLWTVEITAENVTLNGFTPDGNGGHQREYVIALEDPTDDGSFGAGDPDRLVTNGTF